MVTIFLYKPLGDEVFWQTSFSKKVRPLSFYYNDLFWQQMKEIKDAKTEFGSEYLQENTVWCLLNLIPIVLMMQISKICIFTWRSTTAQLGLNHVCVILSRRCDTITSVWYYVSHLRDTSFETSFRHRKKYLADVLSFGPCNSEWNVLQK